MKDENKCPYCGYNEFIDCKQDGYASISPANKVLSFKTQTLYHKICLNCGTVIKSYIKEPKKLLSKKESEII